MEDTSSLDFNFWPSFADAMLAIVFVMTLLFVVVLMGIQSRASNATSLMEEVDSLRTAVDRLKTAAEQRKVMEGVRQRLREQTVEVTQIRERQKRIRDRVAAMYDGRIRAVEDESTSVEQPVYVVYDENGRRVITFYEDIQLQRLTFNGNVLFNPARYALSRRGKRLLEAVGRAIDDEISSIERVQIEGHTDDRPATRYRGGNLELGTLRAMSVFRFFVQNEKINVDPSRHNMSVTSFGPYKPVAPNGQAQSRARNRRIELLLFFRNHTLPVARK